MDPQTQEQGTQQTVNKGDEKLVKDIIESLRQSRQKHEMRWYLADNFYENNHFVKAANSLGQLEVIKQAKGVNIRPIPRAKKQINSLVNLTVANNPRWTIYPDFSQGALADPARFEETAKGVQQWFDTLYYYLRLKDQARKLVFNGFKYNVGYAEVGGDASGNIFLDIYEPYDIWHEPGITELRETSVIVKGVSRTLQYIKDSKGPDGQPLYKEAYTSNLKPSERLALSDWKNIKLRESARGIQTPVSDPRIARAFLREVWFKDGDTWTLATECDGKVLRLEKTEFTEHKFVAYTPQEGLLYQPSKFDDLMSSNRSIDILTAMVEAHARTTGVPRLLKSKLSKVNRILNEVGEFIEYEGNQKPEWMQPAAAPSTAIESIELHKSFMDEIGTSIVSFGKVPAGVKAARALESLQNAEFQNQQTAIDRLEKTLGEIAEQVLDIADKYFTEPVTVNYMQEGVPQTLKLVSANSNYAENEASDAIPVSRKYGVRVEIESGLAYTAEGKRQAAMELGDKGYLPKEEVLKSLNFSNVAEILDKLKAEGAAQTSIVQTPEFQKLPAELRLQIVEALTGRQVTPAAPDAPPAAA